MACLPPFARNTVCKTVSFELPEPLRLALAVSGIPIWEAAPLTGGIHSAARIAGPKGEFFLKWRWGGEEEPFQCEADGLRLLASKGAIAVPDIIGVRFFPAGAYSPEALAFLVLEYIAPTKPQNELRFCHTLAYRLAELHQPDERYTSYGLEQDNFLGPFTQKNTQRIADWCIFYRDCRLLPQIAEARKRHHLTPERERLLMKLIERLPVLLNGLPPEVSLIHGDLWSGNYLCESEDMPYLIDPAVYFGHREVEMAYVELFPGFPPGFLDAYHAAYPLDAGYARRRSLHQLYPLL